MDSMFSMYGVELISSGFMLDGFASRTDSFASNMFGRS